MFVLVGAVFAIVGLAVTLNLGGAADLLARYNATPKRRLERAYEPGFYPQSRAGARLWGLGTLLMGLFCIWVMTW